MPSIEPTDCCGQINYVKEVASGLVVAGSDGMVLLELAEKVLNQITRPVEVAVVSAAASGKNDNILAGILQQRDYPFPGVIGFVGNVSGCLDVRQKAVGPFQIVSLPRCKAKPGRVAPGIGGGVKLGAQSAAAASNGSFFGAPFLAYR